ncbi:MAG: enoyl-CoA hydratase/isomerase family protein [Actinomycetia bacterium]|nr:enoyl-CoA hydratase/isomerase family protein [Actinomycetes bacterium]
MTDGSIRTEREGGRVTVVVDRPHKRNALSRHVQDELAAVLDDLAIDESISALVLTGAGTDNFTSGGDLVALSEIRTIEGAEEMARHARGVPDRVRRFPAPVVAALNGDALGGGAELAMACDFRVLANHARMAFVQGRQAITSAWGGGVDLVQLVGRSVALRLLCTTEFVDHDQGLRIGLYDLCAGPDEPFDQVVDEFVVPIVRQSPHVARTYKALAIATRMGGPREHLEEVELSHFSRNWMHDDHWTALDAFLNRSRD